MKGFSCREAFNLSDDQLPRGSKWALSITGLESAKLFFAYRVIGEKNNKKEGMRYHESTHWSSNSRKSPKTHPETFQPPRFPQRHSKPINADLHKVRGKQNQSSFTRGRKNATKTPTNWAFFIDARLFRSCALPLCLWNVWRRMFSHFEFSVDRKSHWWQITPNEKPKWNLQTYIDRWYWSGPVDGPSWDLPSKNSGSFLYNATHVYSCLENRKNEFVNAEEKTVKNRMRNKLVYVELATSFYDIGNDGPSRPP